MARMRIDGRRECPMKTKAERLLPEKKSLSQRILRSVYQYKWFYLFALPGILYFLLFKYFPIILGVIVSLKNYSPFSGRGLKAIFEAPSAGLYHYKRLFMQKDFYRVLGNTLRISLKKLVFTFPAPIIFALLLNEVGCVKFKRTVQTVSYLPHFISMVVVAGMVISFTDMNGLINTFLGLFGVEAKEWLTKPEYFPAIYTITTVWKGFGFNSILYFSSLSSIDPALYEAARIDGANRWQQMRYVTLPSLAFIIAVQLVMETGKMLQSNTDLILLLYNSTNASMSDTIGTYVYRTGIESGKYSLATAVGLFSSVIGLALTFITNKVSNKVSGYGLW